MLQMWALSAAFPPSYGKSEAGITRAHQFCQIKNIMWSKKARGRNSTSKALAIILLT